jgi:predicted ABC-type transport system involved in lysophospholipase L1 biosynthesis ATPase subunit
MVTHDPSLARRARREIQLLDGVVKPVDAAAA